MLTFENIGKQFPDGTVALEGVNLHVPKGQFCVVLGPSGAGKSTLLRTVNGLVEPTNGAIAVGGVPVTRKTLPAIRPRIGMIHQQFNLVLRASVGVNVLAGALPAVSNWRALLMLFPKHLREKACGLVDEVGLQAEHLHRRASDLSGGQQQRVGIARAFILDPSVVLADEPVASLDPKISRDILALLKAESRERNATVLCSLHQIDLARHFADRIVALRNGRVAFDGLPDDFDEGVASDIYGDSISGSLIKATPRQRAVA
ncbi:MAG: phosphonate ABC transporter ATP-binding protein [Pseudolabrys sp.]|nr:phosphonate ABC transporter ATP-binding protein [Pseudolabrys sp.]